jgi:hypothetical protein
MPWIGSEVNDSVEDCLAEPLSDFAKSLPWNSQLCARLLPGSARLVLLLVSPRIPPSLHTNHNQHHSRSSGSTSSQPNIPTGGKIHRGVVRHWLLARRSS